MLRGVRVSPASYGVPRGRVGRFHWRVRLIWYRKWRGLFRWSQYRFGDPYLEIAFNPGLPTPTFVSLLKADSSQMRIPLQSISLEEMSQADVVKAKEAESVDCLLKSLLRDREDLRLIEGYLDKLQQHGEMFPLPMTPQDVLDCGETHGTAKGLFEAKCQIQKKLVSA